MKSVSFLPLFFAKKSAISLTPRTIFSEKKKIERRSRYPPMQSTQIQKQTKGFLVLLYNTPNKLPQVHEAQAINFKITALSHKD